MMALVLIEQPSEEKRNRAIEFARVNNLAYDEGSEQTARDAAVTLAWCLFKTGREVEALAVVRQALNAGGVNLDSAYFAAQILHDRGQIAAARQIIEPVLQSRNQFPTRAAAEALLLRLPEDAADGE